MAQGLAYIGGLVVLVLLWLLYKVLSGSWDLGRFVEGADKRPSTSKFQWLLWTIVVLYSYAAIVIERTVFVAQALQSGLPAPFPITPDNLPPSVLAAMGLATATMAVAKGVTASQITAGKPKPPPSEHPSAASPGGAAALVLDDDGFPDLSKMQLLAWTLLAIAVYLANLVFQISGATPKLPDIDNALMGLMGIGQAGYLGKKIVG